MKKTKIKLFQFPLGYTIDIESIEYFSTDPRDYDYRDCDFMTYLSKLEVYIREHIKEESIVSIEWKLVQPLIRIWTPLIVRAEVTIKREIWKCSTNRNEEHPTLPF